MTPGLVAYDVLGYGGAWRWDSAASPIYPSGPAAVTLSIGDWVEGAWALDAAVDVEAAHTVALVHYTRADCPSVYSASREVATFPGYTCRAGTTSVVCAPVGDGRWTWANTE